MPDKSRDENCRIFLPVENNLFVLLATFITSYTKLPSSWQIISQQFFRCNRGSVSQQALLLSIFFIVFFSANSNDIFENSQNLVSIDQTTCGATRVDHTRATTYYKVRNTGTRNTRGTVEYPGIVAEQRNISEHQRNINVTPAEHPGTTEPYTTKNNCI